MVLLFEEESKLNTQKFRHKKQLMNLQQDLMREEYDLKMKMLDKILEITEKGGSIKISEFKT